MTEKERKELYDRVVEHYNNNDSTVRKTAVACGISKTTVHNILTKRRPNPISAEKLERNKMERHLRGGEATKRKYQKRRQQKKWRESKRKSRENKLQSMESRLQNKEFRLQTKKNGHLLQLKEKRWKYGRE